MQMRQGIVLSYDKRTLHYCDAEIVQSVHVLALTLAALTQG